MTDKRSEAKTIETLGRLLEEATVEKKPKVETGACVYSAGTKTYCASLSKADCDALSGAWTKGGKCP